MVFEMDKGSDPGVLAVAEDQVWIAPVKLFALS
jgi:hypothetical protein